jgi:hypothetical protein
MRALKNTLSLLKQVYGQGRWVEKALERIPLNRSFYSLQHL